MPLLPLDSYAQRSGISTRDDALISDAIITATSQRIATTTPAKLLICALEHLDCAGVTGS